MNLLRYIFNPKVLAPILGVFMIGLISYAALGQGPVSAATCDKNNDIVYCGYTSPADLASKVQASGELQTLYNHAFTTGYGIGDVNNWKANAKHATVYKDGRIVLDDGTVIATGANSIGRQKFNDQRLPIKISNTTYYYSSTGAAFGPNTSSLPAYVLVNDDHSLKFAALTACGNAVWGNSAAYKCNMLNQEKVNDTTYNFSTTVTKNNATLTKLVYDFGDGKSQTVTSNFDQKVTHTYAPGKYTAKVTAYFSVNGQEKSDTRVECTKPVDVPQPPKVTFACDNLTPFQISRTKYRFTVKGVSQNANFVSAKFDFGDSQTAADLKGQNETVTTEHDYAKEGTYTVKAYLTYKEGTTTEVPKCVAKVTVNEQTCADKPNAPECQPPKEECKPGIPKGDNRCQETPPIIPETGPTEIIGGALGLSGIAGAGAYYHTTRRNWINQIFKKR